MSTEEGGLETSTQTTEMSVGARLIAARGAAQLSVAQVAQRLHCGRDLIEALEGDRFADLGAPVFARGHLRRYAELLGLSVEDMLAHLARQETREQPLPDLTQVPRAQSLWLDWRTVRPMAIGAVAIALFALLVWLVLTQTPNANGPSTASSSSSQTQKPVAEPTTDLASTRELTPDTESSVAVASGFADGTVGERPAATAVATTTTAIRNEPEIADSSSAPVRPTVVAQRGGFSLAVSVAEACWIEIYDKDDNALFYDMAQPGRRIEVSGAAPVRVRLGVAEAVSLEFLGRRVSVPPELIRESLAHFTLSADGRFTRYRPRTSLTSPDEARASGT
jgi:cytoskeleton protein RodZ